MRFCVELALENPYITKEKNKMIMHVLKLLFESTDSDKYQEMYEQKKNNEKNFTFSTYLGRGVKFNREDIYLPDKKILLNFSTYDISEGILFYNSFVENIGLEIPVENNIITINKVKKLNMGLIEENILFSTSSPLVVREHSGDNKKTWYYDISNEKGFEVFKENLRYQLKSNIENIKDKDIDEIQIKVLKNKLVKIKHYGITIPANLAIINVNAKAYIIDYLYKAGIGSRRSQGFGFLNIV